MTLTPHIKLQWCSLMTKVFIQTPIRQYIRQLEQLRGQAVSDGQPTESLDNQLSVMYVHRDLGLNWVEIPTGV
jgi:hypothetical protein